MRSRRSRHALAVGAALVASALVVAGCGTAGGGGDKQSGKPLPGVTASTVHLGFSIVDLGDLAKSLGFKQPEYGGFEKQSAAVTAVVNYVNKNGGMGGRQVQATIKRYVGGTDSPAQSEAQCKGFTQDDKVMAAMLDGGFQSNTVPCFVAANTLIILQALLANDQTAFEKNSPYLWSPTHPEYSGFVAAQLAAMKAANFFDGNTGVLLVPADDEVSRRVTDTVVKPFLAQNGVNKMQTSYIDSTNTGTLGATSTAALTAGKNGNLNRVIVIGGARIEPVILSDTNANNYNSTWSVSTYDNPIFTQNNPDSIVTALRNGMTGIGYAPAQDVDQNQAPAFPDPANPSQKLCYDIITAAGAAPPNNLRSNWKNALLYCDAVMFMKDVLDKAPKGDTVTGNDFKTAAGQIGDTYHSALAFGSQWGPGVYAGTNSAKTLAWSAACTCFTYSGDVIKFAAGPATAGSTGAPASAPLETITIAP